ncbi:hypothetical protein CQW23_14276 [Capsicum baccatum]|uniref:Uncharacterized protein n=1 Tax=Capsicum baccatum TaxID=33114 RepID=A0A2G2WIP9_CAPBA|nr:hypothetical protein CQW23_14276 [Capsicum baccatum]
MVINTELSVMAYNYPTKKLSAYLSDDVGSELTFYALIEAFHFAKHWLPYCKKFNIELRSPAAYFASSSVSGQSDPDFSKIKILIDSRDEEKKDIDGVRLPNFVYVA